MVLSSNTSLPAVSGAFEWTSERWGAALRCRPLGAVAPHLFTTRLRDLSLEHLRSLSLSVGAEGVAMAKQVHGRGVIVVRDGLPALDAQPEGDVLVSSSAASAIAVRVADCVPLLMADRARGVVAAVHAGWRGTAVRAAVAAVEALGREFGTRPADLIAAIGPCIGGCCYEVGTSLVDAFAAEGHERHLIDRWFIAPPPPRGSHERPAYAEGFGEARHSAPARRRPRLRLDIARANRDQLLLAGVPEEQIHDSGLCTAMHLDLLTSYRKEGEKAGRMLGVIRAA